MPDPFTAGMLARPVPKRNQLSADPGSSPCPFGDRWREQTLHTIRAPPGVLEVVPRPAPAPAVRANRGGTQQQFAIVPRPGSELEFDPCDGASSLVHQAAN